MIISIFLICEVSPFIPDLPADYLQYLPRIMGSFYASEIVNMHAIYFAFQGVGTDCTVQISMCHTDIPGEEDDEIIEFFQHHEIERVILDTLMSMRVLLYFAQKPNVDINIYKNKKCVHRLDFPVSIMRNRNLERDMYKESPVDPNFFFPIFSCLLRPARTPKRDQEQRLKLALLSGECFSDHEWLAITE